MLLTRCALGIFGRVVLALSAAALGGCSSKPPMDPADQARNVKTDVPTRVAAVDALWEKERSGDHGAARESMKRLAWQASAPGAVRIRAIEILCDDTGEENRADTRNMLRLMLPTEPNMDVIECISGKAAAWGPKAVELTPSLVRSYSRKTDPPPDGSRPELAALLALHPGESLDKIVFEQFLAPLPAAGAASAAELERAQKAKNAAWELLARLDLDGARRTALLADGVPTSDPVVANLRVCAAELKCIPLTAAQLDWLTALRDFSGKEGTGGSAAWWEEAKQSVAVLPADRLVGWSMRNVEPLRWARAHRPEWVAMDRTGLEAKLRAQFKGRALAIRGDESRGGGEMFADNASKLSWGDLLTLAVADEAVRSTSVLADLPGQIERDRNDTTTEYGGILFWAEGSPGSAGGGQWKALMYTPRPGQRQGDTEFVPPAEMLVEGCRAAFHYHLHVQKSENREYAGPGPGDLGFADAQGRACLVLTTIRADIADVDYYQAGHVVVDLGEVKLK